MDKPLFSAVEMSVNSDHNFYKSQKNTEKIFINLTI